MQTQQRKHNTKCIEDGYYLGTFKNYVGGGGKSTVHKLIVIITNAIWYKMHVVWLHERVMCFSGWQSIININLKIHIKPGNNRS